MTDVSVLICDDELALREMVAEYLEERDYLVYQAENASALRERVTDDDPDLIILDIRMPGEDGLSALRWVRGNSATPVIMLTAAADTTDRVVGLEMGADDYLGKPVDLRELEARIKAVLRRHGSDTGATEPIGGTVQFGECKLDLEGCRLFGEDGERIPITAMEYSLLKLFARNRGRVLTRDQILEDAHDRHWEPFDRSIDLRISRLRRKIETNPNHPEVIRTVRGVGYIFG